MVLEFIALSALALAVGGLIGLERERGRKTPVLGTRTFALVSFLGFLLSYFTAQNPLGWITVGTGFAGAFVLAALYYFFRVRYSYYGRMSLGLTTTFVIPLAFFLGTLIGRHLFLEAGVAAIACVYLLVEKKELRELGETLTKQELIDLLLFIVIAFIIYPQLPAREVSVLGLGLNLQYFWFIVVAVSAISFTGHLLAKYYKTKAVFYTAFLGGFVSSLATTAVFVKKTANERVLFTAITAAALASTLSNALVIALVSLTLLQTALPIIAAFAVLYAVTAWFSLKSLHWNEELALGQRALSLRFSLEFAIVFFVVSLAFGTLQQSPLGAVAFSFLSGLVSSTSVYAAVAYAYNTGTLSLQTALYSLAFASIGSVMMKAALAAFSVKSGRFRRKLAGLIAVACFASVFAAFLAG
ncbi:MAG: MgtC/SapB family protein [Candidatus Micrarchaeota archaeon]